MSVPDPGVLYRKLTSGDAAGIAAVSQSLSDARSAMNDAAERIATGTSEATARWQGDSADEFSTSTTAKAKEIALTYQRLHTATGVLDRAAGAYRTLRAQADAAYWPWRALGPSGLDKNPELALGVIRNLMEARDTYEGKLRAYAAALTDDSDRDPSDLSHVGKNSPWIPQGLAYLGSARDQLLVASYHDGTENDDGSLQQTDDKISPDAVSRLSVVNNSDGSEEKYVELAGTRYEGPIGQELHGAPPNHVGGVAAHGGNVWVTSTEGSPPDQKSQVYVYSQEDIDNAKAGQPVHPKQVIDTPASSYVSYADGKLWIGQYRTNDNVDAEDAEPKLYGYSVDEGGSIDRSVAPEEYTTPRYVQGAVVRDDELIFSKSGEDPGLYTYDRGGDLDPDDPRDYHADEHKVEEIEEINGEIVTLHEGGAREYLSFLGRMLHDGSGDLSRTPLDELGIGGGAGYESDPDALQGAAGVFDEAAGVLDGTASRVSGLQLVPHTLGEVPVAAPFAATVTRFLTRCGRSLGTSAEAMGEVADSLVTNAETYRRQEDTLMDGFRGLFGGD